MFRATLRVLLFGRFVPMRSVSMGKRMRADRHSDKSFERVSPAQGASQFLSIRFWRSAQNKTPQDNLSCGVVRISGIDQAPGGAGGSAGSNGDRKSTRLNSSHI